MDDELLAGLTPEFFVERWRRRLTERPEIAAGARRWVAVAHGETVGFTSAGPPRDDEPPFGGELYAIHVLADHHDLGIGKALLKEALSYLRSLDPQGTYLWVLTGNVRSRAIYEHLGWKLDGAARTFASGLRIVEEHRYRLRFT